MRRFRLMLLAVVFLSAVGLLYSQDQPMLPGDGDCALTNSCDPEPPPPPPPPSADVPVACEDDATLTAYSIGRISPAADGKIHVTYGYYDALNNAVNPGDPIKNATTTALAAWQSRLPNIVFEPAGSGPAHVRISLRDDDPTLAGGCVAISGGNGALSYNSTFKELAASHPEKAATGMKHEIGHYLGLRHKAHDSDPASIMNSASGSCSNPTYRTSEIQENDATKSRECVTRSQNLQQESDGGGGDGTERYKSWVYEAPCYQLWTIYDVYYWNGEFWRYIGSFAVLEFSFC